MVFAPLTSANTSSSDTGLAMKANQRSGAAQWTDQNGTVDPHSRVSGPSDHLAQTTKLGIAIAAA
jgi:hypothetical protein